MLIDNIEIIEDLNVVSLFNGHSGGNISLDEAGIPYKNYYSSEVDKHALKMEKHLYPDNIQMGNVKNVYYKDGVLTTDNGVFYVGKIGLLLGGSPCQSFSFAGKRNGMTTIENIEVVTLEQYLTLKAENFEFEGYSYLFWEYMRILEEIRIDNSDVLFMLENVKMDKNWNIVINDATGVEPVFINSSLVSAQNRRRLYWTNIPGKELTLFGNKISQPKDKKILLKDIIHETEFEAVLKGHDKFHSKNNKSNCIDANYFKGIDNRSQRSQRSQRSHIVEWLNKYKVDFDKTLNILDKEVESGKVGYFRSDSQANRVYYIHDKAVTLCGEAGGGAAKMGQYLFGCITPDRLNKGQNGQRFNKGYKFFTLTAQDKHGVLIEGYIRKLTPIECGRLQTIPESIINKMMESGVSESQIYKQLGNGWTIDVIVHILQGAKEILNI